MVQLAAVKSSQDKLWKKTSLIAFQKLTVKKGNLPINFIYQISYIHLLNWGCPCVRNQADHSWEIFKEINPERVRECLQPKEANANNCGNGHFQFIPDGEPLLCQVPYLNSVEILNSGDYSAHWVRTHGALARLEPFSGGLPLPSTEQRHWRCLKFLSVVPRSAGERI